MANHGDKTCRLTSVARKVSADTTATIAGDVIPTHLARRAAKRDEGSFPPLLLAKDSLRPAKCQNWILLTNSLGRILNPNLPFGSDMHAVLYW